MRLHGNVALIVGAARGIGEAAALRMANEGAALVVADRNSAGATAIAARIREQGGRSLPVTADVTSRSAIDLMVRQAVEEFGQVDILVNCAGDYVPLKGTLSMPETDWDSVVDSNLKATFLCCQAVLPLMIKRRYGRIVNIASLAGRSSSPLLGAHYTAAKAGVLGLTRHLAKEFGPFGVTVNAVAPGPTHGPRVSELITPAQEVEMKKAIPLGRLAEADDIVPAILFLASEEARYITGATLDVNGGALMM